METCGGTFVKISQTNTTKLNNNNKMKTNSFKEKPIKQKHNENEKLILYLVGTKHNSIDELKKSKICKNIKTFNKSKSVEIIDLTIEKD